MLVSSTDMNIPTTTTASGTPQGAGAEGGAAGNGRRAVAVAEGAAPAAADPASVSPGRVACDALIALRLPGVD
jgi:hypothetical protein